MVTVLEVQYSVHMIWSPHIKWNDMQPVIMSVAGQYVLSEHSTGNDKNMKEIYYGAHCTNLLLVQS